MNALNRAHGWLDHSEEWTEMWRNLSTTPPQFHARCHNKKRKARRKKGEPKLKESLDKPKKNRKRRREDQSPRLPAFDRPTIIFPAAIDKRVPTVPVQAPLCVVNALAGILPLDANIRLFGVLHPVVLVAVFYRRQNLCWLMVDRRTHRLFTTADFAVGMLHLFKSWRSVLGFEGRHNFNRQGVNEILDVACPVTKRRIKFNSLPRGVLRFTNTQDAMRDVQEFLRGTGTSGHFLRLFTRTRQLPVVFDPIAPSLTSIEATTRMYLNVNCVHGRDKNLPDECGACCECLCHEPRVHETDRTIGWLMHQARSSVENCITLQNHFAPFIAFMRANPCFRFEP